MSDEVTYTEESEMERLVALLDDRLGRARRSRDGIDVVVAPGR
ncbi:hypothetical protein [Nocardioides flavescens]|nr:hypothetical protein [Nocardioides flavescens]